MVKKILIIAFMIFLTACTVNSNEPVSSSDPVTDETQVIVNSYQPQLSDNQFNQGNVYIDSSEILTLESFPLQFTLHIKGNLPTPCHKLRVAVQPPDDQNQILVEVYSLVDPDKMCTQVLEPFEINVPLGSFPAGKYTVIVNSEVIAEFQS